MLAKPFYRTLERVEGNTVLFCYFFNWDSLHTRLNSKHEAWSYKKKNHKKIKPCRNSG